MPFTIVDVAGPIISATGDAGAGSGTGAAVDLSGALIGDQMQTRQKQDAAAQQQIRRSRLRSIDGKGS